MLKRAITVVLVPHNQGGTKSLKIPVSVVLLSFLVLLGFCTTIILFFLDYKQKRLELAEFENLDRIVMEQNSHLALLREKLGNLKGGLQGLAKIDVELKEATNIYNHGIRGGVGGSLDVGRSITPTIDCQRSNELIDRIRFEVEQMQMEIAARQDSFKDLDEYLDKQSHRRAATPSIWPIRGSITSRFGMRKDPFQKGKQKMEMHTGIDISARRGTPIWASADGVIKFAGWKGDYGKVVYIDHGYGYETRYAHNSKLTVEKWQRVKRGDIIAYVGNTGRSSGIHLHYEILLNDGRYQKPINPYLFLLN